MVSTKISVEFEKAYHSAGGQDEFVMVPPDGEDGHGYYRHVAAWSDRVDAFLRAHDLLPLTEPMPLPPIPDVTAPVGLGERGQEAFRRFLAGGPYRAFATNGAEVYGYAVGQFEQDLADKLAIENCTRASKGAGKCTVVSYGQKVPAK